MGTGNGSTRHIQLNSVAAASLQSLEQSSGQGLVFLTKNGVPLRGYKHWFDKVINEAGIRDFTWYCLRHTFASRLVMAGVDIRTVAELMGHRSIQMTMRYAHLAQQHNKMRLSDSLTRWAMPVIKVLVTRKQELTPKPTPVVVALLMNNRTASINSFRLC